MVGIGPSVALGPNNPLKSYHRVLHAANEFFEWASQQLFLRFKSI